jgi:hypothetical protein
VWYSDYLLLRISIIMSAITPAADSRDRIAGSLIDTGIATTPHDNPDSINNNAVNSFCEFIESSSVIYPWLRLQYHPDRQDSHRDLSLHYQSMVANYVEALYLRVETRIMPTGKSAFLKHHPATLICLSDCFSPRTCSIAAFFRHCTLYIGANFLSGKESRNNARRYTYYWCSVNFHSNPFRSVRKLADNYILKDRESTGRCLQFAMNSAPCLVVQLRWKTAGTDIPCVTVNFRDAVLLCHLARSCRTTPCYSQMAASP